LQVSHCHHDEHPLTSVTLDPKAQFTVFLSNTKGQLRTLRVARGLGRSSKPAANATFCGTLNERDTNSSGPIRVDAMQGYLLVYGDTQLSVYNATRAAHFAPWHVFDIPLNTSSGQSKLMVSSDGAHSFIVADSQRVAMSIHHTELPQLSTPPGFDLPSRPYIIGAAIVIVFAYQFFRSRKSSKLKDDDDDDDAGFSRGGRKFGVPPTSSSRFDNPSKDKFGKGKGLSGIGDFGREMESIGSRTKELETQIGRLGGMTNDLASSVRR